METISFSGVPFLINDAGELFAYYCPSVKIGSYSKEKILTLEEDWLKYYARRYMKSRPIWNSELSIAKQSRAS